MNLMHSTLLNSTVANQTVKNVKDGAATGENTKEDDRSDMKLFFFCGIMLGVFYLIEKPYGLFDFFYMFMYFFCQLSIISVSWNDEQGEKVIKTSYILQAILSVCMLVPFILEIKDIVGIVFMSIWCLGDTIYPLVKLYKMQKNSVK